MEKINIHKDESIAELVEKIIESKEKEVTLIIPHDSRLKESGANFRLLKREADGAKKKIHIESVDEDILKMARENGLENIHPLFDNQLKQSLSDIVSGGADEKDNKPVKHLKIFSYGRKKEHLKPAHHSVAHHTHHVESELKIEQPEEEITDEDISSAKKKIKAVKILKFCAGFLIALLVIGGIVFIVDKFFAKADISITLRKTPWQFQGDILADKRFSQPDASQNQLPLEYFSQSKNITQLFPASGRKNVSEKATGVMTVYNNYSSAPQVLVATTRFETTDGKIFRLDNQIVVPGAEVSGGKIVPSSIDAPVTAEKTGTDYNVGPISRLNIPGFAGTSRYDGFYGSLKTGTSGGLIGNKAVPTDKDIADAKNKVTAVLQAAFQNSFLDNLPSGFVFLDGASKINITKLSVNTNTDTQGNFSVFGEADFEGLAFKENDIKIFLNAAAAQNYASSTFFDLQYNYQNPQPDFVNGKMPFVLSAKGDLVSRISADDLKNEILSKKIKDVRSLILALPGLEKAQVSVWPSWLGSVPSNPNKVKISVN